MGVYYAMNAQSQHATQVGLPIEGTRVSADRPKKHLLFDSLAVVAIAGLVLGVSDIFGAGSFSGLCLAFGAIFFGLAYIVKMLQKAEEAPLIRPPADPGNEHSE